jgi:putative photosynthetic complex assembly protein
LVAAAALLLTSLGLAASARGRDESVGRSDAPVSQGVRLRFEDGADGSVVVLDASGARRLATVPPAEGGFVRGVMRGMFRTRKLESIDRTAPFHLLRLSDGALVLEDPTNGRRVDLRSFGDTNYRAFSALLATEPPTAP